MLNRQRVLLAFIDTAQASGLRGLGRAQLTKFAFLFRETVGASAGLTYEFVPYKYGPFSFALYRELDGLVAQGLVCEAGEDRSFLSISSSSQAWVHSEADKLPKAACPALREVAGTYGALKHEELLRTVYAAFPWYAQHTERPELVTTPVPSKLTAEIAAYTVGYEGKCIDGFLAGLLRKGIQQIVDVRRNPISRKYGFAKSTLMRNLSNLGLAYVHIPELGIASEERADLSDPKSYEALLDRYERSLPEKTTHVDRVVELLHKNAAALLCMESNPLMCHRSRLATRAAKVGGLKLCHLT